MLNKSGKKAERQKIRGETRKANGLCPRCGASSSLNFFHCAECRGKDKARRQELRLQGRCVTCGRQNYDETKTRCISCKTRHNKSGVKVLANKRIKAFEAYGGPRCNCCGEEEVKFLTLDHINGLEGKPRTAHIASWLAQNNYPEGYQVLCYNCNCAKGFFGMCPHQAEEEVIVA